MAHSGSRAIHTTHTARAARTAAVHSSLALPQVVQSSSRNPVGFTEVRLLGRNKSESLTLKLIRGNSVQAVRYSAPIAPVHAFSAALALAHWSTETKGGRKI